VFGLLIILLLLVIIACIIWYCRKRLQHATPILVADQDAMQCTGNTGFSKSTLDSQCPLKDRPRTQTQISELRVWSQVKPTTYHNILTLTMILVRSERHLNRIQKIPIMMLIMWMLTHLNRKRDTQNDLDWLTDQVVSITNQMKHQFKGHFKWYCQQTRTNTCFYWTTVNLITDKHFSSDQDTKRLCTILIQKETYIQKN